MPRKRYDLCPCGKRASFNYEGNKTGSHCKKCKLPGMIDVINKKCLDEQCNKVPNFNFPNEKKGLYCSEHSKVGMISVTTSKSQICQKENCSKRCSYGIFGQKAQYCATHKKLE